MPLATPNFLAYVSSGWWVGDVTHYNVRAHEVAYETGGIYLPFWGTEHSPNISYEKLSIPFPAKALEKTISKARMRSLASLETARDVYPRRTDTGLLKRRQTALPLW